MKTVIEMLEHVALNIQMANNGNYTRFTGCVHTSEINIDCVVQELQMKGYWVEYRRIGGSDNYVIKVEW